METVGVATGGDQQICSRVGSYAKGFDQRRCRRLNGPFNLGPQVLDLLAELTVTTGKRTKCVLGRCRGVPQTTRAEASAPRSEGIGAETIKRSRSSAGAVRTSAFIWLTACVRAFTAESFALLSIRIISTSPSPDLGVSVLIVKPDRPDRAGSCSPAVSPREFLDAPRR